MPREPAKNRINMHDIVGQPLGALHDAVDAILRRPEMLDDIEVRSIFKESSFILLRAEEALSARDEVAFCSLFKLFCEGFAHSEDSFETGIKTMALHAPLLQTIHSLFRVVVEQGAFPLHSAGTVELIQVLSSLCDGDAIKETCGSLFMAGLASALERVYADPGEAMRFYHTQRGIATALINLVKGSKQNKSRLASWRFVGVCCAASVDVFFQLQCVELLFRVSRQNKSILMQLDGALPSSILSKLRSLPNDHTLLARMSGLIEAMNASRTDVAHYPLTEVAAADTLLSESTDAYFSPHYLIVMITSANADNVTIPYRSIRSVTLGKDGRVIFKLDEFPVKLEALLSRTGGMDTVTLHMSVEKLSEFKQSPIRSWIVAALQARREFQHQLQQGSGGRGGEPARPASSFGVKRPPSPPRSVPADPKISISERPISFGGNQKSKDEEDGLGTLQPTALFSRNDGEQDRKKTKLEEPLPFPTSAGPTATRLIATIDNLIQHSASSAETHAVLVQLKRLLDAKTEIRRGAAVAQLNTTVTRIQTLVDAARTAAQESRSVCEKGMSVRVEALEQHVVETQEVVASAVGRLNEDLREVRSSNQAINERIACLEVDLQQTLEESRGREEQDWAAISEMCAKEIERQEFALDQLLLNRANSAAVFSDYLRAHGSDRIVH